MKQHGKERISFGQSSHTYLRISWNLGDEIFPKGVGVVTLQKLFGFIRGCFAHRRKSLWNNLQSVIGKDPAVKEKMTAVLAQLDISPQIRPEKLTLEQFIELANALHQQNLL